MPAEQRIIGGGLLLIGIAICLILIYLFAWGGLSPTEGHEKLVDEIYPAYLEAEKSGDYLAIKRAAEDAIKTLDEAGKAGIAKIVAGDATSGNREAKRLHELISSGAFEKNADGLFELDGDWFREASHRALKRIKRATDDLKALGAIRRTAHNARTALDEVRLGSGLPLALPPAKAQPNDPVPIVDPNPVYGHDAELYRVFGLRGDALQGALGTKADSGRARSARLRWNKASRDNLSNDVQSIPEEADALRTIANHIERSARELADDADASKKRDEYLQLAARLLGAGLAGDQKAAYDENRAKFENGNAIATVLRGEAAMLAPYLTTVRDLGRALAGRFAE